jgi:hypothetical protein
MAIHVGASEWLGKAWMVYFNIRTSVSLFQFFFFPVSPSLKIKTSIGPLET